MTTAAVTEETFEADVLAANGPVLVDFTADWCAPCHAITPSLEALAEELAGRVTITTLDVDMNPSIATRYGVRSMPTLIMFKNGQPTAMQVGASPKGRLSDWVRNAL